jgi:2-polyprenyl-6-methoxyphenol hydroxylase-like FAD-dependent oxidoreductase
MKRKKAIIIGGGIGGMALAVALRQQSVEVEVYEQADALREVGAGLVLWPNAMTALDTLGLVPALRAVSAPFGDSEIRDWQGALLTRLITPDLPGLVPGALIYRTQLLDVLAHAFSADVAHLNARCVHVQQDSGGVTAEFADGSTATGDVLIGADGIHSVVRQALFGDVPMRYAGYTVWRGTSNVPIEQPIGLEMWGKGRRFGCRTTTPGRVYWYATANTPEHVPEDERGRRLELLTRFQGWHAPVEAILNGSDDAHILRNPIYNMARLKQWSVGRITLLGDAAHALTPNLGQGACQAIEDAVILARLLGHCADVETTLKMYEARRMARVYAIAARARRLGEIGQWENRLAREVRNRLAQSLPTRLRQRQMEWLFRFESS